MLARNFLRTQNCFLYAKRFYSDTKFCPVTHIIFDMDGTLLDTEKVYKTVFHEIAKEHGKEITQTLLEQVHGVNLQTTARIMVTGLQLPMTIEKFIEELEERGKERMENVPLKPGVLKLMCHLFINNIPMGLATSSPRDQIELKTRKNHSRLFSLLEFIVSGSSDKEVKKGKPAPDIFLIAASRFSDKPDPEKCLVFEDSANGILSGFCAGMQVVAIPEDPLPTGFERLATIVIPTLEDFKPELFGLPKYS